MSALARVRASASLCCRAAKAASVFSTLFVTRPPVLQHGYSTVLRPSRRVKVNRTWGLLRMRIGQVRGAGLAQTETIRIAPEGERAAGSDNESTTRTSQGQVSWWRTWP